VIETDIANGTFFCPTTLKETGVVLRQASIDVDTSPHFIQFGELLSTHWTRDNNVGVT
jgi:hypothetical protein